MKIFYCILHLSFLNGFQYTRTLFGMILLKNATQIYLFISFNSEQNYRSRLGKGLPLVSSSVV